MQTLYNLATIAGAFKILSDNYSYTLYYNIAYFSIFILLFKREMSFVPLKRMLIRIAKTRLSICVLILLFNQESNALQLVAQRNEIVNCMIAIPFFSGLVFNFESGRVPFKAMVQISQQIDLTDGKIATPKLRLYLTLICVLLKSHQYLMDWKSEAKFPDLLMSGAAIGGGIIFPILFTIESFYRRRKEKEQREKEKQD